MPGDPEKLLLTPEEAAEVLGVCRSKVYKLLRVGALDSVRVGGSRRIPTVALHEFVEQLRRGELQVSA